MPGQHCPVPAMFGWMGTGWLSADVISGGKDTGPRPGGRHGFPVSGHPGKMDGIGNGVIGVDNFPRKRVGM